MGKGVYAEKCRERPNLANHQAIGWTSCMTQWTRGSCLPFWHLGLKNSTDEQFVYLAGHLFQLLHLYDEHFQKLERLTVILCDETSPLSCVNEARRELFCPKNREMDKLPPTKDALLQHVRRTGASSYLNDQHTNTVWSFATQNFAWTKVSESCVPVWMTIPEVFRSYLELIKCSWCSCGKTNLDCSPLCKCRCTPRNTEDCQCVLQKT